MLNDPVLTAVLCSLAGARTGDRVAVVGVEPAVGRALLAMTDTEELVDDEAASSSPERRTRSRRR